MMLEGKVALVTGATGGIGEAIARTFAKEGASVAIHYFSNQAKADALCQELGQMGANVLAVGGNIADFETCKSIVESVITAFGRLDILVNNAGITKDGLIMRMSEADFDQVIDTNLKGCFNGIRFASRQMMKRRSGRIINISSVTGVGGNAGQANYAASKAGMLGLTKSVAKELAPRGVTVNAIAPGFVKTPMTEVLSEKIKETYLAGIPLGRFAEPEDVANAALFLASDMASYITGQTLLVDGGMIM